MSSAEAPVARATGLTVMMVHAHPDDETTKGGATAAWLAARGARTILVTCTDGSAGDVTDPALLGDRSLAAVRSEELAAAAAILGYERVHELGYPDSGTDAEVEGGFASLPVDPLVQRLAGLMAAEQPEVVVAYEPKYAKLHPDHRRCHEIAAGAFATASRSGRGPHKLYGARFSSIEHVQAMHRWQTDRGRPSRYDKALERISKIGPDAFTTKVHVGDHVVDARNALRQHRSQISHDNPFYFAIPDDEIVNVYPYETFELLATSPHFPTIANFPEPESTHEFGLESDLLTGLL